MSAIASTTKASLHKTIPSFRAFRRSIGGTLKVGFVPTMGALHEGHLSLVSRARSDNDIVVASIFVNPTQFGPNEDFDKYPRRLEEDMEKLSNLGVDHVFAPAAMYSQEHLTYVNLDGFDGIPEGKSRPGHFQGVATIVTKLFNVVQPTNAYFGQKDAAQCVLIRKMVDDLNMDVNVVVLDTVREPDGLAMSSRNAYLTGIERAAAPVIFRSLSAAKERFNSLQPGETISSSALQIIVKNILANEQLMKDIQYVSVDSKTTMQPLDSVSAHEGAIISLACKIGTVRLIDNIVL